MMIAQMMVVVSTGGSERGTPSTAFWGWNGNSGLGLMDDGFLLVVVLGRELLWWQMLLFATFLGARGGLMGGGAYGSRESREKGVDRWIKVSIVGA